MEEVRYPCFAFRPKGFMIDKCKRNGTSFIYYNLEPLVDYLISSGDFRDPKTREPYSETTLKSIDNAVFTGIRYVPSVFLKFSEGTRI